MNEKTSNAKNNREKFDAVKYKNDFQKENYDRISVVVKKGHKDLLLTIAKEKGYNSLNDFIVTAIYKEAGILKPDNKPKGRKAAENSIL